MVELVCKSINFLKCFDFSSAQDSRMKVIAKSIKKVSMWNVSGIEPRKIPASNMAQIAGAPQKKQ